jgi:hypothetical protein
MRLDACTIGLIFDKIQGDLAEDSSGLKSQRDETMGGTNFPVLMTLCYSCFLSDSPSLSRAQMEV